MDITLTHDYDPVGDVLYIFDGEPRDTLNVDIDENVVLRLDPKAHRAVGMMIHNVSLISERVNKRTLGGMVYLAQAMIKSYNRMFENYPDAERVLVGQTA